MRAKYPALGLLLALLAFSPRETLAQTPSAMAAQVSVPAPAVAVIAKAMPSVAIVTVRRRGIEKPVIAAGFAITPNHILTAHHVIRDAETFTVSLPGRVVLTGELDFEDAAHDLAVVRVGYKLPLVPLRLASRLPERGEDVIAIGHPKGLGYQYTVSTGVISGLGREIELAAGTLKGLLQHTAAISPGNSGGPLLDAAGDVLGINVAMHSEAALIAFAVSAETIRERLGTRYTLPGPAEPVQVKPKKPKGPKTAPITPTPTPPAAIPPMSYAPPEPMRRADD